MELSHASLQAVQRDGASWRSRPLTHVCVPLTVLPLPMLNEPLLLSPTLPCGIVYEERKKKEGFGKEGGWGEGGRSVGRMAARHADTE